MGLVALMDGTVQIASAAINSNGNVSFTVPNLLGGEHLLSAIYLGADGYMGSIAKATVYVAKLATKVALATGTNPLPLGQYANFLAEAIPP